MSSLVSPLSTPPLNSRFAPEERFAPRQPTVDVRTSVDGFIARATSPPSPGEGRRQADAAVMFSPPARELQAQPQETRVNIHACGRLETIAVHSVSVDDLCVAARRVFDFPTDQDLLLTDREYEPVSGDVALRSMIGRGDTIYVRLSEGALHDFEQRIDQLQHMQIGYVCDQLASFRQEHADLRVEIKHLQAAIGQEQTVREHSSDACLRGMEDLRASVNLMYQSRDHRLDELETALRDVKQIMRDDGVAREHVGQETLRQFQEVRAGLQAESRAREAGDEKLRREAEEARRSIQLEVGDREDCEVRFERQMQELQRSAGEATERQASELADLWRQFLDIKQASAMEQRERMTADSDLAGAMQELRTNLTNEARERSSDATANRAMRDAVDTALEAERLARQQAVTELTQQLSVAVEGIQEEQSLRSSEDAELSQMVEVLRKNVEDARRRQVEAESTAARLAHDLAKRFDEEVHTRDVEVSKLARLLNEEAVTRQDALGKVNRLVAGLQEEHASECERRAREAKEVTQRIEHCNSSIKAEGRQRITLGEELSERLLQQRRQNVEENGARMADNSEVTNSVREIRELLDQERVVRAERVSDLIGRFEVFDAQRQEFADGLVKASQGIAQEQKERESVQSEVKELRAFLDRETQAREKDVRALSRNLSETTKGVVDTESEALTSKIREECLEVVHTDMSSLREGLTKVVEAVQQERRSRAEGDNKLRTDCAEAIQKEINARLELATKMEKELAAEGRARMEAVEVIELAIQECRQGLETHTHELTVDEEEEGGFSKAKSEVLRGVAEEEGMSSDEGDRSAQANRRNASFS